MRLAVISDIHGNLTALETVLEDLAQTPDIDLTWCLGDLAAFGPRPAECVRRIKALAEADEGKTFRVIGGNTDRYLVYGERLRVPTAQDEAEFAQHAQNLIDRDTILNWNFSRLDWECYQFLKGTLRRELSKEVEGYGLVIGYHGVPGDDEAFLLPNTTDEQASDYFLDREGFLGIGGHTHRQMDRTVGRWRMVNVGSIGMSFDQPGIAQYGIFTFEGGKVDVELRALPYDVEGATADLHAAGHPLPHWFASRIRPE
ncbi:MAG: metallophosphatase family protein [Anaerolineae bacterium]|jgi:predicted phosphodiesterase|nr:metallophosphatase family protein [Anaerolineae bacterium]